MSTRRSLEASECENFYISVGGEEIQCDHDFQCDHCGSHVLAERPTLGLVYRRICPDCNAVYAIFPWTEQ